MAAPATSSNGREGSDKTQGQVGRWCRLASMKRRYTGKAVVAASVVLAVRVRMEIGDVGGLDLRTLALLAVDSHKVPVVREPAAHTAFFTCCACEFPECWRR